MFVPQKFKNKGFDVFSSWNLFKNHHKWPYQAQIFSKKLPFAWGKCQLPCMQDDQSGEKTHPCEVYTRQTN